MNLLFHCIIDNKKRDRAINSTIVNIRYRNLTVIIDEMVGNFLFVG